MLVIISDTSVISNFLHLNRLDILHSLYGQVCIPPAVFDELTKLLDQTGSPNPLEQEAWLYVQKPADDFQIHQFLEVLDRGEAEAIVLALELKADFLLVDELLGRKEARKYKLKIIGTLGILLKAKQERIIPFIKPLVDQLMEKGFWIHSSLYQQVLELASESGTK